MPATSIELNFSNAPLFSDAGAVLTVLVCTPDSTTSDGEKSAVRWTPELETLAARFGSRDLRGLFTEESFTGQHGQVLYLPDSPAGRVLLVGVGSRQVAVHRFETALAKALARIKLRQLPLVAIAVPDLERPAASVVLGLVSAVYQFCYRSRETREAGPVVGRLNLHGPADLITADAAKSLLSEVNAMCLGQALTMDLVNTPSNIKRTTTLVEQARTFEKNLGLTVEVVDDVRWIESNMPCFFTVARGSLATDPPKWIHVIYRPNGPVQRKVALVGKAVIFDTGGYQVKTDGFMNTMKADMAGSAAVFGAMQALAMLRPDGLEVHAFFAATPNMIDSEAMLPDAIVDTTCGKKVEIRHTDAEGRLTLIDAVAMAEREGPEAIVTVATLTGAASRAVGMGMALLSRPAHETWRDAMEAAAHAAGDRVQTLNLMDEDFDDIKSKLDAADIINTNRGKSRGAQTAAAFVMNGAPATRPLIHLDIAGGDMSDDEKATGIAAKSLIQFVLHHLPAKSS